MRAAERIVAICLVMGVIAILVSTMHVGVAAQKESPDKAQALPKAKALPAPSLAGKISLEETLVKRRSVRQFENKPLTIEQIGQLLWAAQGRVEAPEFPKGFEGPRTAPSAGALYPLELYVLTQEGVFHYLPTGHRLETTSRNDLRAELQKAALGQTAVGQAPAVFVFAAEYARTSKKYGEVRTPRYVHIEVGAAGQNLLLEAVALGLGAVPIGAFRDEEVQAALSLPKQFEPLYIIPVGYPKAQ
jgi:SagB-type dehydrogenase family enzyme